MKNRNKAVPAVYLVLKQGELILLSLRQNTGYEDGNYQTVAGHVEAGELPKGAMIREAKEEIGINLFPEDLSLVHVMYREAHTNTGDRIDYFFFADRWGGEIVNREPEKCVELKWFRPEELPENISPHVRYALDAIGREEMYSELDKDWFRERGRYLLPI